MASTRGRKLHPSELDDGQRALYDAIVSGPRSDRPGAGSLVDGEGSLEGPFNTFLLQPALGQALQSVGATLRYGTDLDDRLREIAILVVAAHHGAEFEQHVHEPIARGLGVTDEQLAAVRAGEHASLEADDALVATAAQEMLDGGDVRDDTFDSLRGRLGDAAIFELTSVVGYYATLALQLRVFRVTTPGTTRSH
jgi:4-carboxymuconolactone decarboxylase